MDARTERMVGLFRTGNTLQQIGDEYGITRERVRQIISRAGIKREDGGVYIKRFLNAAHKERKPKRDGRYHVFYGCSKEDAERLNCGKKVSVKGSHAHLYSRQRRNANRRGIAWEITFPQWLEIWIASGHFDERGRGKGYCMARFGDSGPYHPDNVEIITVAQNSSDSYIVTPWKDRFNKRNLTAGRPVSSAASSDSP